MTGDLLLFAVTVVSFAVAITAHLAIVAGLAGRTPRVRAIVALLIAPLAPYWAVREKMRIRGALWVVGVVAYAIARWVGRGGRG